MKFKETKIKGVYLIHLDKKKDNRGFFARYFCSKEFSKKKLNTKWVQINNSVNKKVGTLRGLHYQKKPNEEIKLVRCIKGSIWDVSVDLRKNSQTFGKWYGTKLSETNRKMVYIPKGFAHGFMTLTEKVVVSYLVSSSYSKTNERGFRWDDPAFEIKWPASAPILSERDQNHLPFSATTMSLGIDLLED